MSITTSWDTETLAAWRSFVSSEELTDYQASQFERYMALLVEWNEITNITRIIEPKEVINLHFKDSLSLVKARNLSFCKGICDVGSGGGFPGIPLAIRYPEIPIILLEVNKKKCSFLQAVIDALHLSLCQVVSEDYRTFLRTTDYPIDYFVARASLRPDELVRALTAHAYKNAEVVYWASRHWEAEGQEKKFLAERYEYLLEGQSRFLVFFKHL